MNHQSAAGGQTQREALAGKIVIGISARGLCAPGAGPAKDKHPAGVLL